MGIGNINQFLGQFFIFNKLKLFIFFAVFAFCRYNLADDAFAFLLSAFRSVLDAQEVPGTTPANCGHYLMHDLDMAKWYAREFVEYLEANAENEAVFEYPKTERLVTEQGQKFYDS